MAGNAQEARRRMGQKAVHVRDGECLWKDPRQSKVLCVFKPSVWP